MKKNAPYEINWTTNTITVSKRFMEASTIIGQGTYNTMMELRKLNMPISVREIHRKKPGRMWSFERMEYYLNHVEDSEKYWAQYANDNYYLLAYNRKKMKYYRLDRLESISVLEEENEGEEEFEEIKKELPFRAQTSFNLFGGEKTMVTLRAPVYYYYLIADQFGMNLYPILEKSKQFFTVTVPVALGDQFFGWVMAMGYKVEVVDPPEARDFIRGKIKAMVNRYNRYRHTNYDDYLSL